MISYGKQNIDESDISAVIDALRSDYLTQGPKTIEFEHELSRYYGAKYTKVVSNGTAALHLAYLAVGLSKNDRVWVTPNTFVATANAALYCGAVVDFVDIDSKTYNISIDHLKEKLVRAKRNGVLPKLVVPVHFAGQSCEMKDIWELSKEYGFKVIEDSCHALGGEYRGNKIGSCEYSDMSVFSFHPVKMITTGEGGAISTNCERLDQRVEILRSHGITKESNRFIRDIDDKWYYEQQCLGFNYRMTDIQAALGISQLKRLDSFVSVRREIAGRYMEALDSDVLPYQHCDAKSSWHLFVVNLDDRKRMYDKMRQEGIASQVHYIPIPMQPFYDREVPKNSNTFYQRCLSLPIYADLKLSEQRKVIEVLSG